MHTAIEINNLELFSLAHSHLSITSVSRKLILVTIPVAIMVVEDELMTDDKCVKIIEDSLQRNEHLLHLVY